VEPRKSQDSNLQMVKGERTFELVVAWVFLHRCECLPAMSSHPTIRVTHVLQSALKQLQRWCFHFARGLGSGEPRRCLYTQWAVGLPRLLRDSRGPRTKIPVFLAIESALLSSSVLYCGWDGKALLVPSYHIAIPFIFFVITAGNFVRLEETFTSIKPPNLHQASDRLGPNGSRFTSFQAPSIRLTVTADGPVILSIFHTQTSGLLTALCTLGNCFCCELNFN